MAGAVVVVVEAGAVAEGVEVVDVGAGDVDVLPRGAPGCGTVVGVKPTGRDAVPQPAGSVPARAHTSAQTTTGASTAPVERCACGRSSAIP